MTSVLTFACLQMLALRDVSPALNCQLHVHRARMAVHFSAGRALENLGSRDRIGQYYSASRDGHHSEPSALSEPGSEHNLRGASAFGYVSKITVTNTIAI